MMSSPEISPVQGESSSGGALSSNSLRTEDPAVPSPPFFDFVMLLEDISKRRNNKNQILRHYFNEWRTKGYGSMYPVIRLLLPQLDRERGRYGLKESKMTELYMKSLNIVQGSDAANRLKYWKEGMQESAGDFSLVVLDVIKNRSTVDHSQGQSIRDVNALLTGLSRKGSDSVAVFQSLVQTYTPLENKWIVRIINRDLKIGMSERSVLPCFHQDAVEYFNVCSDLHKTVIDCADPNARISTSTVNIFHPFKPMLSKGLHKASEIVASMKYQPFWIENKLDGERIQVHKKGDQYRYWSRNSTEFTHLYGANPQSGSLTPFIHPLINTKAESLILDGEMVEYDPATKQILPFGTVKTAGGNHSADAHKTRPCLFVFDVLFMNGASVIDQPLEARHAMLPRLIPQEDPGRLELLPHQVGTTEAHINDALDTSVLDRQEGIIIKNPRSTYAPNGRSEDWVKLKPEYVDGVCDNLDVLIVGGYYGSGNRGGQHTVSSYLCAVRNDVVRPEDGKKKFTTFCKFGTGFSFEMMGNFSRRLGPFWQEYRKNFSENPWVEMIDNAKMRPDVIIDPQKSIVVEIKAAEIVPNSVSYASEYTLRFPRFVRIRDDKDSTSCMTMTDIHSTYRESTRKLSYKSATGSMTGATKIRKKQGPRKAAQAHLLQSVVGDMSKVKQVENLFNGQVFYVLRGDNEESKGELEIKIKEYGGVQSQSESRENTIVIAGQNTGPKPLGLMAKGNRNIVFPSWIRDCIRENRLIPLNPKYMYFATAETEKQFRRIMDQFEDSYTEPLATIEALEEILSKMPNRHQEILKKRKRALADRTFSLKIKKLKESVEEPTIQSSQDTRDILHLRANAATAAAASNSRLKPEIMHPWEGKEAERAQKIVASITRKYYGENGEAEGPLGMFQGVKVFVVFPPTPEEYLQSLLTSRAVSSSFASLGTLKAKGVVKDEGQDEREKHTKDKLIDMDHDDNNESAEEHDAQDSLPSTFRILSRALQQWSQRREKQAAEMMIEFDTKGLSGRGEDGLGHAWRYLASEMDQGHELTGILKTLADFETCRQNLFMVSTMLEIHGGKVIPCTDTHSSIQRCQQIIRDRHKGDDVGIPFSYYILLDPLFLQPLDHWIKATAPSILYGGGSSAGEGEGLEKSGSLARPRPRPVTPDWVKKSHERGYRLPEEGFHPELLS